MEPEKTKQLQQMANCAVKLVSHINAYNNFGLNYHLNKVNNPALKGGALWSRARDSCHIGAVYSAP